MTRHSKISYWKSGFRIVGFLFMIPASHTMLVFAAIWLILAEGLGILEEIGATY